MTIPFPDHNPTEGQRIWGNLMANILPPADIESVREYMRSDSGVLVLRFDKGANLKTGLLKYASTVCLGFKIEMPFEWRSERIGIPPFQLMFLGLLKTFCWVRFQISEAELIVEAQTPDNQSAMDYSAYESYLIKMLNKYLPQMFERNSANFTWARDVIRVSFNLDEWSDEYESARRV